MQPPKPEQVDGVITKMRIGPLTMTKDQMNNVLTKYHDIIYDEMIETGEHWEVRMHEVFEAARERLWREFHEADEAYISDLQARREYYEDDR